MNVTCAQCRTVFRVDPRKVPATGVRARCSVCGGVFEVLQDDKPGAAAAAPLAGVLPQAEAAPAPFRAAPAPPEPPEPISSEPDSATAPTVQAPSGSPPPAAAPKPAPRSPFGVGDQESRARRLARALISDVAAYHPERQERGLREGRLKELFQDELRKSWQEYVDQVGLDTAKNTPFFRDALNEILAKGKRVF